MITGLISYVIHVIYDKDKDLILHIDNLYKILLDIAKTRDKLNYVEPSFTNFVSHANRMCVQYEEIKKYIDTNSLKSKRVEFNKVYKQIDSHLHMINLILNDLKTEQQRREVSQAKPEDIYKTFGNLVNIPKLDDFVKNVRCSVITKYHLNHIRKKMETDLEKYKQKQQEKNA